MATVLDESPERANYRRLVVLRCVLFLDDAIHKNGGLYSGSLVPNFTSVSMLLTIPFAEVLKAVEDFPALDPQNNYPGLTPEKVN